jgi:aspartate racemase
MKTIGLLGGMSWESTAVYYRALNEGVRAALGGQHSARLLLWSADFATIAAMQAAGDWAGATAVLADAARRLEGAGAEALLICANTMHLMADEVAAAVGCPVLHIADAIAEVLHESALSRPLVLGTRFTMEMPFYRERLRRRALAPTIPDEEGRAGLHRIIFEELVQGRFEAGSRAEVASIAARAIDRSDADAVLLACTEFGLLVGPQDFSVPMFDTTLIHARAAVRFALS